MGGIAGICNLGALAPVDEVTLRHMLASVWHRGPDQAILFLAGQVGLGSVWRTAVDSPYGRQPGYGENSSAWIVLDGEIHNAGQLKRELEDRGHRLEVHSDAEVVLALFQEMGPDCLSLLNGQFAFAVWDRERQSLFLARDRFGFCPLFYAMVDEAVVFGSEMKAILADKRLKAEIDPVGLDQVFSFCGTLPPRTIFRDIVELPPGHFLFAENGRLAVQPYWTPSFSEEEPSDADRRAGKEASVDSRLEHHLDQFEELLLDAVRLRLGDKVAIGAVCDGGLELPILATVVAHVAAEKPVVFVGLTEEHAYLAPDVQDLADVTSGYHKIDITNSEIGTALADATWHAEIPVLRITPMLQYLLSKHIRAQEFDVVLTGDGAEEILAGSDIYKQAKIRRFWARRPDSRMRPALLDRLHPEIASMPNRSRDFVADYFSHRLTDTDRPEYSHVIRWRETGRIKRLFSNKLCSDLADAYYHISHELESCDHHEAQGIHYPPGFDQWGELHQSQYLEITTFLSPFLLSSAGDRMRMAHGLTGRAPFLDHRLVEFCSQLPQSFKLRGLTDKLILRRLIARWSSAPPQKPRKHQACPTVYWNVVDGPLPDDARGLLEVDELKEVGIFDPSAVRQLMINMGNKQRQNQADHMALVGVLSTQLFYHQFVSDFRLPPPIPADSLTVIRAEMA